MNRVPVDEKLLSRVKGFLDPEEGAHLYAIACKTAKQGPCLEIGSYCGKATLYLGAACRANRTSLFSIDHHCGSEEQQPGEEYFDPELFNPQTFQVDTFWFFRQTLASADLLDTVIPMVCSSQTAAQAWATPLSLVFIDGGHSYQSVLTDYTVWSPHVMSGGYLIFHDIFLDPRAGGQAPREVYRLALQSGQFEKLAMVKTLGVLRRIE